STAAMNLEQRRQRISLLVEFVDRHSLPKVQVAQPSRTSQCSNPQTRRRRSSILADRKVDPAQAGVDRQSIAGVVDSSVDLDIRGFERVEQILDRSSTRNVDDFRNLAVLDQQS